MRRRDTRTLFLQAAAVIGLLLPVQPTRAQDIPDPGTDPSSEPMMARVGSRLVLLPITSLEWGVPDRWSFTSRGVLELNQARDGAMFHHNLSLSLSPGTAGGRLSLGYLMLVDFPDRDLAFFFEPRAVLLRTWGHPLKAEPDRTLTGFEFRASLGGVFNVGVGW